MQFESPDANFTLALTKLSDNKKGSSKNLVITEDQEIFKKIKKFLPKPTVEFWSKVLIYDIFSDPDDKTHDCSPNELVTIYKKYLQKRITFNKMLSFLNEKAQFNIFLLNGDEHTDSKCSSTGKISSDLEERINQDINWLNSTMRDFRFMKFLQEQYSNGDIKIINLINKFSSEKDTDISVIYQKFTKYCIKN